MNVALLVPLLLAAAPAGKPAAIPDRWNADLEAGLPKGQALVQKLAGDLDGDKKPEWIAVGTSKGEPGTVSIAVFAPPAKGGKPTLRFSQWFKAPGATVAGAVIRPIDPVGPAVVLVAAAPDPNGDSSFFVNVYAWRGTDYRGLVPEQLTFKSQGGFAIEDIDPQGKGAEIVAWTWLPEAGEQLYDYHRYAYLTWRFDGIRWVRDDREKQTAEKFPDPAAAARAIGLKGGDLRKTVPNVVAVP